MIKEARVLVRVVALWIIFVGSIYLTFFTVGNFVTTTFTLVSGGYNPYPSYSNLSTNCMTPPMYPSTYPPPPNETDRTDELNKLNKYQADQEAYNKRTQELCEQDQQKQKEISLKSEQTQEKQNQSSSRSSVAREAILMAIGFGVLSISFREIRKIEQA